MQAPRGSGLSVRGLAAVGLTALVLLCLVVAGSVAWVAGQLQGTSSSLVRDSESLRLATRIELLLLNYQRLAALTDDPRAQQDSGSVSADLQASIRQIVALAASARENALIGRSAQDVDAYLEQRTELAQSGIPVKEIQRRARPYLNSALESLRKLAERDEQEVHAAYADAQRVGSFFIAAAAATVALAALLLVLMTVAIRNLLLRPVLGLRDTIDRYRGGDPNARADENAPREIADIARAFNEMSHELERRKARELTFIAGVAHDLRNPLAALQYSLDAMQVQNRGWDAETERLVGVLDRQLAHLRRMVSDLLETCYIEAGELTLSREPFDLREAVKAVVDLYGPAAADHTVELALADAPVPVYADRTRIEQVVGNLLSNSIKYSPPGSRIGIGARCLDGTAELYVTDEGAGIKAEDRERIFEPFWRGDGVGKRSGTGLGLSVVRKIVVAHAGTITVESRPGEGSVFRVRVPASADADMPATA